MPLYEGIGLISEKHAVVLEIGSALTKCGYAGEMSPRCIVPSKVDGQSLHSLTTSSALYSALVEFVHQLYFKWLLVNPKDRRVVVVENVLGNSLFKDTLAKVLFRHYEVSSVLFVPSHLVSLFTLGVRTGLVVDCGHRETTVIPVYEGVPILAAWQAQPLAGEAIQSAIKADLACRGVVTKGEEGGEEPVNPEDLVADVALRACFITNINRGRQLSRLVEDSEAAAELENWRQESEVPSVVIPCGGDKLLKVTGLTREVSSELLWAVNEDHMSLACMVLDAIAASPIDCRLELASSLVLVGGTAMMHGFKARLNQELKALLTTEKYSSLNIEAFKVFQPPAQPNYVCWLGGAIFGATDVVVTRSLTREQYLRDPAVPDWANLRFNSQYLEERQG